MRRRRPPASKVLAALSVLLAAGATLLLRGHLARLEARAATPGDTRPVVVATADLSRGTTLSGAMLRTMEVPDAYRPPGALSRPGDAAGRTLVADVAAGEAITATRLARGGPLAALVPAGLRAVPIAVPLHAGALRPGDRVDVLAAFAVGRGYAETVVAGAEVLRVLAGSEPAAGTVTVLLLVGPDDAERLVQARSSADLSLAIAPLT